MRGFFSILTVGAIALSAAHAAAHDNPVVRNLLAKRIEMELSKHDSQDSAWKNEDTRRQRYGFVRWREEVRTWIWLDKPQENLSVTVSQFTLEDGRVAFSASAEGKVRAKASARVRNVARGNVKAKATAFITVAGSFEIAEGTLVNATVTELDGRISDLRFNNTLLSAFEGWIESVANDFIKQSQGELKQRLEDAIHGATF